MNKILLVYLLIISASASGFSQFSVVAAKEYAGMIQNLKNPVIIDVRTKGEYEKGYVKGAINISSNDPKLSEKLALIDKSGPVFIYCLSGGRSSNVSGKMKGLGFQQVYDLKGGMMQWKAAGLPVTSDLAGATITGISLKEYHKIVKDSALVLIDFYAEWCAPCKKMKPDLDEIALEKKSSLKIIRIDADINPEICKELNIDALPVLLLYKSGDLIWKHTGYLDKAGILNVLN